MNADELIEKINELIAAQKYEQIKEQILLYKKVAEKNNEIATVFYLVKVYEQESAAAQENIFEKVENVEQLLVRYTRLKFYLRRIDFDVIGESLAEFFNFLAEEKVSSYELKTVLDYTVVHRDKVLKVLCG